MNLEFALGQISHDIAETISIVEESRVDQLEFLFTIICILFNPEQFHKGFLIAWTASREHSFVIELCTNICMQITGICFLNNVLLNHRFFLIFILSFLIFSFLIFRIIWKLRWNSVRINFMSVNSLLSIILVRLWFWSLLRGLYHWLRLWLCLWQRLRLWLWLLLRRWLLLRLWLRLNSWLRLGQWLLLRYWLSLRLRLSLGNRLCLRQWLCLGLEFY